VEEVVVVVVVVVVMMMIIIFIIVVVVIIIIIVFVIMNLQTCTSLTLAHIVMRQAEGRGDTPTTAARRP